MVLLPTQITSGSGSSRRRAPDFLASLSRPALARESSSSYECGTGENPDSWYFNYAFQGFDTLASKRGRSSGLTWETLVTRVRPRLGFGFGVSPRCSLPALASRLSSRGSPPIHVHNACICNDTGILRRQRQLASPR